MLLVGNGRLITRDDAAPYWENGAVVLEGEVVKEAGTSPPCGPGTPRRNSWTQGAVVIMPGLINVHTHIYSGLARGLSIDGFRPTNFYEILDGQWWNIDRRLTLDGTRACAWAHPCWTASGTG